MSITYQKYRPWQGRRALTDKIGERSGPGGRDDADGDKRLPHADTDHVKVIVLQQERGTRRRTQHRQQYVNEACEADSTQSTARDTLRRFFQLARHVRPDNAT